MYTGVVPVIGRIHHPGQVAYFHPPWSVEQDIDDVEGVITTRYGLVKNVALGRPTNVEVDLIFLAHLKASSGTVTLPDATVGGQAVSLPDVQLRSNVTV